MTERHAGRGRGDLHIDVVARTHRIDCGLMGRVEAHGIKVKHIPPSSPNLNGRIERPHGVDKWRYKKITTSSYTFEELREFCEDDCLDYNTYRPHSMLRNMTPVEFLQSLEGYKTAYPDFSVLY